MKKNYFILLVALAPTFFTANAQKCCNVNGVNGLSVTTTDGICLHAPNLNGGADCGTVAAPAEEKAAVVVDYDADGFVDSLDKCPTVAGTLAGCPDGDADGFADKEDKCPTIAGKLGGCPDGDADGVADKEDKCPTVAGTLQGCPDGDKDGIADAEDKCPKVAGIAANSGCPAVKEEVKEVLKQALTGIKFRTGSNVISSSSYGILANVVDVLKTNPAYNLTISGYTDNTGNAASNLALSDRRAHAVESYLINKGIDASRLTAQGYGIANPIADNGTAAGREQNRRVDLKVVFK